MTARKKYFRKKSRPASASRGTGREEKHDAAALQAAIKALAYQNHQKEQRAQELVIANEELAFQNGQKEKRAQELAIANKELAYQNEQKEKRAAELELANIELAYQNEQKEKRAQELAIANIELAYQNEQKEQRAAELAEAIRDLEAFAYVSSHHLQEPLRKIRSFVDRVLDRDAQQLSEKGRHDLERIDVATARMSQLIQDVYTYSRINVTEASFEHVAAAPLLAEAIGELRPRIEETGALVAADLRLEVDVIPAQFRQVLRQLLDNALKFSRPGLPPRITITGTAPVDADALQGLGAPGERYCCIQVRDEGLGFDPQFNESIFRIFQKLHPVEEYPGTGIGLAIVRKIMHRHKGYVTASGEPGAGTTFRLYFPMRPERAPQDLSG